MDHKSPYSAILPCDPSLHSLRIEPGNRVALRTMDIVRVCVERILIDFACFRNRGGRMKTATQPIHAYTISPDMTFEKA